MSRPGQVAIIKKEDWAKMHRVAGSKTHETIWALMQHTGARITEILELDVRDCYSNPSERVVLSEIIYRQENRKGKDKNHTVPVNTALKEALESYPAPEYGYMFPSHRSSTGRLSYEAVLKFLQKCADKVGLGIKKIGTHSGRRSLITALAEKGTDLRTIQRISGHSSLTNLQRYIEYNPERARLALEAL